VQREHDYVQISMIIGSDKSSCTRIQRGAKLLPKNRVIVGVVAVAMICTMAGVAIFFEWGHSSKGSLLARDVSMARYMLECLIVHVWIEASCTSMCIENSNLKTK